MIGDLILAATDERAEGRHAVLVARAIAGGAASARWTVLTVAPIVSKGPVSAGRLISSTDPEPVPEFDQFSGWLGAEVLGGVGPPPEVALAFGVPGIEISRLARLREANLIVMGRRARAPDRPLELGETSDAVVRRSDIPVLLVPTRVTGFRRVVAALDGTERARTVLQAAMAIAGRLGANLEALMVEPELADESQPWMPSPMPRARTVQFAELLRGGPGGEDPPLTVRRGNPIEEILAHVQATQADLLVIGYRRGGPPKVIAPTNIARNLLHSAPSAVLTVPL